MACQHGRDRTEVRLVTCVAAGARGSKERPGGGGSGGAIGGCQAWVATEDAGGTPNPSLPSPWGGAGYVTRTRVPGRGDLRLPRPPRRVMDRVSSARIGELGVRGA